MFDEIIKFIALISGLLALAKGLLELFKEFHASKSVLSRRFFIWTTFALIGVAVLIGATWWLTASPSQSVLTVQIWSVQQDQKHAIVFSQRFENPDDISLTDETLKEVGYWITEQIEKNYDFRDTDVQVHVYIPADLSQENLDIQMTPQGPYNVYYYIVDVDKGQKGRINIPIDRNTLKNLGKDFYLEIQRPGYYTETLSVKWGNILDKNFSLQPTTVSIGIEEFTGENNSVATWLSNYFIQNPHFTIKDPSTLNHLREIIEEDEALFAENPMIQVPIRTSLGVDWIISGHYEKN